MGVTPICLYGSLVARKSAIIYGLYGIAKSTSLHPFIEVGVRKVLTCRINALNICVVVWP